MKTFPFILSISLLPACAHTMPEEPFGPCLDMRVFTLVDPDPSGKPPPSAPVSPRQPPSDEFCQEIVLHPELASSKGKKACQEKEKAKKKDLEHLYEEVPSEDPYNE